MPPEIRPELQQLLSGLCDGTLTEAEHARLESLLVSDEVCRRMYLEYIDVHARLLVQPAWSTQTAQVAEAAAGAPPAAEASPAVPAAAVALRHVGVPQAARYALVATATLAASLLVQFFLPPRGAAERHAALAPGSEALPRYVATLTDAAACIWVNPADSWRAGSRLLPGELHLRTGIARIRCDSGADLMLEGPASLRLESASAATILNGKVVFHADETAAMFDLHTPTSTLVHIGTEFAVAVGPEGEEIHVFDGEVQRTPMTGLPDAAGEHLYAGEARRYGVNPAERGQPMPLEPERFVRRLTAVANPGGDAAGLLAYEGFEYTDPWDIRLGQANGGTGWAGPWAPGFARPTRPEDWSILALSPAESLVRPRASTPSRGGCVDYVGFAKYWRRLATPVRLDSDGVYYLSYLFRRSGPPEDEINAVGILLRTADDLPHKKEDSRLRLNIGVGGPNQLFTHLQKVGSRTPLPLSYDKTYLLVAKIVASTSNPDQVLMRIYEPDEPIEREEPGSWTVSGPPFQSDLVFEWLEFHVNSRTRQMMDEIRLGTTWESVTSPWRQ